MWVNPFPIKHTEIHLVMAPKQHIAPGDRLCREDFTATGNLFAWAQRKFKFTGGGFVMRFGTPSQSAGTVLHLHANIIIPDQTGAVEVTLAKNPAKIEEQIRRMFVFEKFRQGILPQDLSPEEFALIKDRI